MDLFDRIYALDRILRNARSPIPGAKLQQELQCSRATLARVIKKMRAHLGAPIKPCRSNGYLYEEIAGRSYQLPGLWLNASELYALLASQQLLANIQPGLLDEHIAPLRDRIEQILKAKHLPRGGQVARRVRIVHAAARRTTAGHFQTVSHALLRRRRLRIRYHARESDAITERNISAQRLVHYRDNWYVDAWDHGKRALRLFAIDRMLSAAVLDAIAKELSDTRLDAHFASAYGIFAGKPKRSAVLRFTSERARWVTDEQWHPQQQSCKLPNGDYELRVPYSDERELMLDILKYGPDVEVLAPPSLRRQVAARLRAAVTKYDM